MGFDDSSGFFTVLHFGHVTVEYKEAAEVELRNLELACSWIEAVRRRASRISGNGELSLRSDDVDVSDILYLDGTNGSEA